MWADIHKPLLSTEVQHGCGQREWLPLETPAVSGTLWPPTSCRALIFKFPLIPFFFLLDSPSHLFSLHIFIPFPVSVYCSPSIHPPVPSFPSPLLARWLVYHWDGCGIKDATPFLFSFLLHRSFSASLSLSLSLSPQSNFSVFPLRGL